MLFYFISNLIKFSICIENAVSAFDEIGISLDCSRQVSVQLKSARFGLVTFNVIQFHSAMHVRYCYCNSIESILFNFVLCFLACKILLTNL